MKAACYFSIGTRPWLRHILSASIASLVVVGAAHGQSTQADAGVMATPSSGQGVSLSYGYHAKYQRFGLAYETAPLWTYSFANNGRLDLSVELGASYWQANHAKPGSMWQLAAVPMLRWWLQPQYYLELGVGPSLLSRAHFAGKELSTRFQFASHIGAGVLINKVHRFDVRYTHVSNAGIKRPNPGLDLIEASYSYLF